MPVFQDAETNKRLTLDFIRHANSGCFKYRRMRDEDGLDFRWPEPFAGDFDRVVGTADDIPQAIVVHCGPVAMNPHAGKSGPVGIVIALRVPPEAASHTNPWLADDQFADLATDRIALLIDNISSHSRHRAAEGARPQRREHVAHQDSPRDLRASAVIDDWKPAATNHMK